MEEIHKAAQRTWIDDTVINVGDFLNEWKHALPFDNCDIDMNDTSLKSLVSDEEYAEIETECGQDALKCEYQEHVEPASKINIPSGVDLETIKLQAEDLERREKDSRYSSAVYHFLKHCNYPPRKILGTDISRIPHKPVNTPEVLLSVQFFIPERRLDPKTTMSHSKMPTFQIEQEFLVLGSQFLTELRDTIECVSDNAIPGDFSDCPTVEPTITCKDLYKSGFFYIDGCFYNDMRDKDCRDYSETIINWAASDKRGIGPFKKAIMEKTRFVDLNIQLGYPYVYIHQGQCQHLMVFSDLRMFSTHDVNNRNAYPLYVQVKPIKRIFCMVCHAYTSSWVVYDNSRLPENPYFFCKQCFIMFNYDTDNNKIGNFRAYHFPDHSKLI